MLKPGDAAPAFTAFDQNGKTVRLDDFRGQSVVLYFYPADHTPGCTDEACRFRDVLPRIRASRAALLGASVDSSESHLRFAKKHWLNFPLLADAGGTIAQSYGVLDADGYADRVTFIIDEDGKIRHVLTNVDPKRHPDEVLSVFASMSNP